MTGRQGLGATVGFALRRARSDPLLVGAAAVTAFLATTLLATAPLYATAISEAGLERRLAGAGPDLAGVAVTVRATADDLDATLTAAGTTVAEHVAPIATASHVTALGPTVGYGTDTATAVAVADWLPAAAELTSGDWPNDAMAQAAVPVVLHEDAAVHLGLSVGDAVELPATDGGGTVEARLVGTHRPVDATSPIWWTDAALRDGVVTGEGTTTVGPFITTRAGLAEAAGRRSIAVHVRAPVDAAAVARSDAGRVRAVLGGLERALADDPATAGASVDTSLPTMLADADAEVTATRATVLLTTVQLAVLALLALALTSGALVSTREVETALVQARGARPRQVVTASLVEGAAVVVPAVALAPFAAAWAVSASSRVGPLAAIELPLSPRVSVAAYAAAAVAGATCLLIVTIPAVRAARSFTAARARRGRATDRPLIQQFGLDLVLIAAAVLGLWQVRRYQGTLATSVGGQAAIDPLLVMTPALVLLAGALASLRLLPLIARSAERVATRWRTLVPTFASRQLARRPGRIGPPALLLVLAVAVAVFGGAYSSTWVASQSDQAGALVGADVAVEPDERIGSGLGPHLVGGGLTALDGVEARTPVVVTGARLPRGRGRAQVLAVDTRTDVALLREDHRPRSLALAELHDPRPLPGPQLPPGSELGFDAALTSTDGEGPTPGTAATVAFTVQDGDGLVHRLPDIEVTRGRGTGRLPLERTDDGQRVGVTGPLRLLGIEVALPAATADVTPDGEVAVAGPTPTVTLALRDLRVDDRPVDLAATSWTPSEPFLLRAAAAPSLRRVDVTVSGIEVELRPGTSLVAGGRTRLHLAPERDDTDQADQAVPIVVTPGFLDATELAVGDTVELATGGAGTRGRIVDTIGYLPGDPGVRAGVLVDLPTFAADRFLRSGETTRADAWWVAVRDGQQETVATEVAAAPFRAPATTTTEGVADDLRDDPIAVGLLGILAFGAAAAGIAALVGALVATALAARERAGEVALLRAVGVTEREMRRWLWLENGVLVGAAVVAGVALGVLTAALVLPSIAGARDGSPAVPGPTLLLPGPMVLVVGFLAFAFVAVVPSVVARMLAGRRVTTALRARQDH